MTASHTTIYHVCACGLPCQGASHPCLLDCTRLAAIPSMFYMLNPSNSYPPTHSCGLVHRDMLYSSLPTSFSLKMPARAMNVSIKPALSVAEAHKATLMQPDAPPVCPAVVPLGPPCHPFLIHTAQVLAPVPPCALDLITSLFCLVPASVSLCASSWMSAD